MSRALKCNTPPVGDKLGNNLAESRIFSSSAVGKFRGSIQLRSIGGGGLKAPLSCLGTPGLWGEGTAAGPEIPPASKMRMDGGVSVALRGALGA